MKRAKATILVVDDEAGVLRLMSAVLRGAGYEVLAAESGYAAFTLMENRTQALGEPRLHLVITDWKMQGWDGMRLLAEIRKEQKYRSVAVVLMSGVVTREELVRAAANKADSVLLKPLVGESLLLKVREILEKRSAAPPEDQAA